MKPSLPPLLILQQVTFFYRCFPINFMQEHLTKHIKFTLCQYYSCSLYSLMSEMERSLCAMDHNI